jgi:hypothetical protein
LYDVHRPWEIEDIVTEDALRLLRHAHDIHEESVGTPGPGKDLDLAEV